MKNIFKNDINKYRMRVDPINEYVKQAATYLNRTTGKDMDTCIELVREVIRENKNGKIVDPVVKYNYRNDVGDKEERECTLTWYIKDTLVNDEILAPSFTTYLSVAEKPSLHVKFVGDNVKFRSIDKKLAFKYKNLGDVDKYIHHDSLQKTKKIFNNSVSGAYASKATILHNPSAHYTLTSITRCVSSIGNAIAESMVAGNRHYSDPDLVIMHITTLISSVDRNDAKRAILDLGLSIPTVDELMEMVLRSTRLYWVSEEREKEIHFVLSKLNLLDRVIFAYTNDLYYLRIFNPEVIKDFITVISTKSKGLTDDPLEVMKNADEYILNLVHHICSEEIKGIDVRYDAMVGTDTLDTLASTVITVTQGLNKYEPLIKGFFRSNSLPINIAYLPDILRRVTVLSDTDSTCATYQEWVEWYHGSVVFSPEATATSAGVMTVMSQVLEHTLYQFTTNMNIKHDKIDLLKMKNEYYWKTMTPLNVSKHYFADVAIREGNVYGEPDIEIKGVHLIASTIPKKYKKISMDVIQEINNTIASNKKISLMKYVNLVINIEQEILREVKKANMDILKSDKIKEASAYKLGPDKSPYIHHMLWEEVFAGKYGAADAPPYSTVKLPTVLKTKTKTKSFLENIEDEDIKDRLTVFLNKHGKETLGTFRLPTIQVGTHGIPDEVISAIDTNRIVFDICNVFYVILEALGFYRKDGMLISEFMSINAGNIDMYNEATLLTA